MDYKRFQNGKSSNHFILQKSFSEKYKSYFYISYLKGWDHMGKDDNIYVKLVLDVHFDKNAPNFHMDKEIISWCPTVEEIAFINDSIQKISQHYWNATDTTNMLSQTKTGTSTTYTSTPTPSTPTTNTTNQTQKYTPPTPTKTDTKTSSQNEASSTRDSTVDLLLRRKKDEKEQKMAFVP